MIHHFGSYQEIKWKNYQLIQYVIILELCLTIKLLQFAGTRSRPRLRPGHDMAEDQVLSQDPDPAELGTVGLTCLNYFIDIIWENVYRVSNINLAFLFNKQ